MSVSDVIKSSRAIKQQVYISYYSCGRDREIRLPLLDESGSELIQASVAVTGISSQYFILHQ